MTLLRRQHSSTNPGRKTRRASLLTILMVMTVLVWNRGAFAVKVVSDQGHTVNEGTSRETAEDVIQSPLNQALTRIIAQLLPRIHYTHKLIGNSLSSQLFDEVFDKLDYNRRFFLQSDIQEFSDYRYKLDDAA